MDILPGPGGECQFFVEPINSVADQDSQYWCLVFKDTP